MKRLILLADDDFSVRGSLSNLIESDEYEVVQAADGREVIRFTESQQPDLIVLDLSLPYMEHWQTYDWLSLHKPEIPVIIISARPPRFPHALRSRRDVYLEKPMEPTILLQTIANSLLTADTGARNGGTTRFL